MRFTVLVVTALVLGGVFLVLRKHAAPGGGKAPLKAPAQRVPHPGPILYSAKQSDVNACDLWLMQPDGSGKKNLTHSRDWETDPVLAPDGTRIAFAVLLGEGEDVTGIYTMALDGSDRRRVTVPGTVGCSPSWSPDGKRIVFTHVEWKAEGGDRMTMSPHLAVIPAEGGALQHLGDGWNPAWSPDGTEILFTNYEGSLSLMPATGGGGRALVMVKPDSEQQVTGDWSPDGRQIAYGSSGTGDQFVMERNGTGVRRLPKASILGGLPRWSPDGKWIFYCGPAADGLWRVDAEGKDAKALVSGMVATGPQGWEAVGMLGIGREEAARQQPPEGPTIPGPESPELAQRLEGWLVTDGEEGGLDAISLPDLKRLPLVRPTGLGTEHEAAIRTHAGPDRSGRVAYVENFMEMDSSRSHHTLNLVRLDGSGKRLLFNRPGDALWKHVMSDQMALSAGGRLVFASRPGKQQLPGALLQTGKLEIWDLDGGKGRQLDVTVVDDGFSWFPDGRRLACVQLVPRESLPALPLKPDDFGKEFAQWKSIPAVCVVDTESGATRVLHVGWRPVVSGDGKVVQLTDYEGRSRLVDATTGTSTPIDLPGFWGIPIALPAADLALYWGLPTQGAPQRWTESNSPLVGPKQEVTIKANILGTKQFITLLPFVDPRSTVTWGPRTEPTAESKKR